jgi:hypothetical protein
MPNKEVVNRHKRSVPLFECFYLFTDKNNVYNPRFNCHWTSLSNNAFPSVFILRSLSLVPCLSFLFVIHSLITFPSFCVPCPMSPILHPLIVPRPLYHFSRLSSLILILCPWSLILPLIPCPSSLVPHPFNLSFGPCPLFLSLVPLVLCPSHLNHHPLFSVFGPF